MILFNTLRAMAYTLSLVNLWSSHSYNYVASLVHIYILACLHCMYNNYTLSND